MSRHNCDKFWFHELPWHCQPELNLDAICRMNSLILLLLLLLFFVLFCFFVCLFLFLCVWFFFFFFFSFGIHGVSCYNQRRNILRMDAHYATPITLPAHSRGTQMLKRLLWITFLLFQSLVTSSQKMPGYISAANTAYPLFCTRWCTWVQWMKLLSLSNLIGSKLN